MERYVTRATMFRMLGANSSGNPRDAVPELLPDARLAWRLAQSPSDKQQVCQPLPGAEVYMEILGDGEILAKADPVAVATTRKTQ